MKSDKIQDERILTEKRNIQSRGYTWAVYILFISVIIQQFFMNTPFSQYAVELFLLIGCGIYVLVSSYMRGIDISNPRGDSKKQILFSAIVSGIASVILYADLSGNYEMNDLMFYFAFFVVFFFISRIIIIVLNRKKLDSIDKELNDEEDRI